MKSLKVLLPELSPAQFTLLENAILKYVIGEDLGPDDDETFAYYENPLRDEQRTRLKQLMKGR